MNLRFIPLVLVALFTFLAQASFAGPLSNQPQARYERIQGQIAEAADHGRGDRYRSGIVLGSGGVLLIAAGLLDPSFGSSGWTLSSAGISYGALGALFIGLGVGTFFSHSPEERLAEEVLIEHEVLTPELKLMATEKRLRAMAQDVRRQRIVAAGFGVGLTAVGGVLYALNAQSSRGIPILLICSGVASTLRHLLLPSEAERLWSNYARDYGIEFTLSTAPTGVAPQPGLALSWNF